MYSSSKLTAYAYRAVLSHVVNIEERKAEMIDEFYCEPSALRDDFSCFLDDYLKKLEELIKTARIVNNPSREELNLLNYLPFVIIGSTVELESLSNKSKHLFKIVSPYDPSNSKKDISYLSAFGKALMLKKPGDIIKTKINRDICSYKIKSIRYEC